MTIYDLYGTAMQRESLVIIVSNSLATYWRYRN